MTESGGAGPGGPQPVAEHVAVGVGALGRWIAEMEEQTGSSEG
jgi:hypothetical protein